MTISDLAFLVGVLASAVTLFAAAFAALRGRGSTAAKLLVTYGVCVVVYLAVSLGVAFLRPHRIRPVDEPWCFDDWCLRVEKVDSAPAGDSVRYEVKLRIYSTARRATQRALGAWIYLFDDRHRLYAPNADASATPLDVELAPLASVETSRVFDVPADVRSLGLVTGHPGDYCAAFDVLIIGQATCLFGRPEAIAIK
jgi:hypothetical protein